jgi:hypothetical protein
MRSSKTYQTSAAALASLCFAASATAAPTVFFAEDPITTQTVTDTASAAKRSLFLRSLIGVRNEDFDSKTPGTVTPLTLSFPGTLDATLNGAGCVDTTNPVLGQCGTTPPNLNPGRWATSGTNFWEVSSGGGFNITFTTAISAFGFYGTDIGDFDGRLQVTLTDTNGKNLVLPIDHSNPADTDNSLLFWGFIDTSVAYTKISFSNTGARADVFAFDDMVIGSREQIRPAPEPGSLALAGLALFGLLATCRRRQR